MPAPAVLLLLAASAGGARAARVRAAARFSDSLSGGVHRLLAKLHLDPSSAPPADPTQAAAAVVEFFQAHGAGGGNASAVPQPACADLLARSVGSLDAAWSDVDVRAALTTACSERGMLALASGNGSAGPQGCLAFAGNLSDARLERLANGTAAGFARVCAQYAAPAARPGHAGEPEEASAADQEAEATGAMVWFAQLVFGIVYYFTVVSKFPKVSADPEAIPEDHPARKLQEMNEVQAMCSGSTTPANAVLSLCCAPARAAHNFHSTDTLNYWAGFAIILCLPFWGMCCSLFVANSCTSMNKKLGGEERNIVMSLLCTYCCAPCVIAQDAESLDLLVGMKTGLCSATPVDAEA